MKNQFTALYYGQEVGRKSNKRKDWAYRVHEPWEIYYLVLKPLSTITNEEVMEALQLSQGVNYRVEERTEDAVILVSGTSRVVFCLTEDEHICFDREVSLKDSTIVDYIRSKGYAYPFLGISVEEQVEKGWISLNENL